MDFVFNKTEQRFYIQAAEQISVQSPLSEKWMQNAAIYNEPYMRALDPDFKSFLSPMESRRLGKILKRALATSITAIKKSDVAQPNAIITGTGLGCIENTEIFLNALCREGEDVQKPACFMQSTHNTISSLIAIHTHNHGYNTTYSHKGISFDCALLDAFTQLKLNKIQTALVGAHDEITPSYFTLLQRIGYVGGGMKGFCGEAAVSVMLGSKSANSMCEIGGIKIMYKPSNDMLQAALHNLLICSDIKYSDIGAVITGVNGNAANDNEYARLTELLVPDIPLLQYKNIFGECYSASGLGFYAAACCLKNKIIPEILQYGSKKVANFPKNILLINQFEGKNVSLILLKSICGK